MCGCGNEFRINKCHELHEWARMGCNDGGDLSPSYGRGRDDASFAYVWNLADHTFPMPSGFSAPQHEALTVNSHYQKRNRLLFFHIAIIYLVFY